MSKPRWRRERWLIVLLLCALPSLSAAWGAFGHRLIADLAEAELSPAARSEAQRLLQREGFDHLRDVAVWADEMRETDEFAWTFPYHFVNFDSPDCVYEAEQRCQDGLCVVGAIERYAAELGDRGRSDAERLQALKWLVHFVGDVHQPLHAGRGSDKGGNTFQVQIDGRGGNLHGVWDYSLLESRGLGLPAYAKALRSTPLPAPTPLDAEIWAEESCRLVEAPDFYPKRRRISDAYLQRSRPLAEQRLREAGSRLAAMLERQLAAPAACADCSAAPAGK